MALGRSKPKPVQKLVDLVARGRQIDRPWQRWPQHSVVFNYIAILL